MVGTGLLVVPQPFFWFRVGFGLLMYGHAARVFALDGTFQRIRDRIGLSAGGAMRLWFGAYVAAGVCAVVGAATSLQGAMAVIVAVLGLLWACMWWWAFRRAGH